MTRFLALLALSLASTITFAAANSPVMVLEIQRPIEVAPGERIGTRMSNVDTTVAGEFWGECTFSNASPKKIELKANQRFLVQVNESLGQPIYRSGQLFIICSHPSVEGRGLNESMKGILQIRNLTQREAAQLADRKLPF